MLGFPRRRKKDFVNDYYMICALEDDAWWTDTDAMASRQRAHTI